MLVGFDSVNELPIFVHRFEFKTFMKKRMYWGAILMAILGLASCQSSDDKKAPRKDFEVGELGRQYLREGWTLCPNTDGVNGQRLSTVGLEGQGVETTVPTTVMNALVQAGEIKDPYQGTNIKEIDASRFDTSWWYRKEFDVVEPKGNVLLNCDGINYRANVWLNGKLVADTSEVKGVFNRFSFDISDRLVAGQNALAIEVFPPKAGDFTIGFVDWAPTPPDKNMGIWREVYLEQSNKVGMKNTFVHTDLDEDFIDATLTVSTELTNFSGEEVSGVLKGKIGEHSFEKPYTLGRNESKKVTISAEEDSVLFMKEAELWWPHTMGEPVMHDLALVAEVDGKPSAKEDVAFGIREYEDYFTKEGHRGYKVNGKKVLIKGGGWVDDLFLGNTTEYNEAQVQYTKHMGLNTIRFEGFWGTSPEIYEICDREGVLAMVGFSCQWEWLAYIGGKKFDEADDAVGGAIDEKWEEDLVADYFLHMTKWLRNHPSVFAWTGGSDRLHPADLEKRYLDIIDQENPGALYLGAAKMHKSPVTGRTGVKMYGPYDYVPPVYWYTDSTHGGAFGFNTETGPGPQPPVLESVLKMMSKEQAWPVTSSNEMWNFHSGRHEFGTMKRYLGPLNERYGSSKDLETFCQLAQVQNYELMRPMFEAFEVNKPKSTGIVQWMLNSAWPETYWQLYDYYLYPTGAFYGTKKANQPVLLAYNYGDQKVYAVNETQEPRNDLRAKIKVLSSDSKVIRTEEKQIVLDPDGVMDVATIGEVKDKNKLYFVSLQLVDVVDSVVADNFYWLSTKPDVMDHDSTGSWIYTPTSQNGDLTYLQKLPKTELSVSHQINSKDEGKEVVVELENKGDKVAFFVELTLKGKKSGEAVLPVFWSDNYISLLPGEKRKVTASVSNKALKSDELLFSYSGMNLK